MIEALFITIILVALIVGAITDLKHHEVPDWLSFGLIFTGLGLRFVAAAGSSDWLIVGYGLLGLAACFLISLIMFYTGQWGGGDSKLLMGIGAMIGLQLNTMPTLLLFIINIFIFGGFYGIGYSILMAVKHKKGFAKEFRSITSNSQVRIIRLISLLLLLSSIVIFFVLKSTPTTLLVFALSIIFFITIHTWIFMKAVEKAAMYKEINVNDLVEGDWVVKNLFSKGKKIAGPKNLGISKRQIAALKKSRIKKVLIKEGIPFVPAFLIAYIATISAGNWISILLGQS